MQAAVLNHLVALVPDAVLNHHRDNPIVHDHDPDRHVDVVAQQLRVCSAAYMALGASLLIITVVGDGDCDGHHDHILVGFLMWIAGAVLLHLSFAAGRFPTVALVAAAGAAHAALKELAVATILALARHWNTIDQLGFNFNH